MSSMYLHYSVVILPWKMVIEKQIVKFRHFIFFILVFFLKDPSSLILTKLTFLTLNWPSPFEESFFFKMLSMSMYYHYLPTRKGPVMDHGM